MASVTLSSSSSDLVFIVLAIYIKILKGLSTSNTICSSSLRKVIRGLVTYSIESSFHYTTC